MLHQKILELRKAVGTSPIHKRDCLISPVNIEEIRRSKYSAVASDSEADESTTKDEPIKAYHCLFGKKDEYGTIFEKGAFKRSIKERGPDSNAKYKITVLYMHDLKDPLCLPSVIKEDDTGLYSEWIPDPEAPNAARVIGQIRRGTINNFSFGFNYIWDKNAVRYDDKEEAVRVFDCELLELSPCTIGAQMGTYAIRGANGLYEDETLIEETDSFIKRMPRKDQLELRELIDRHISLTKLRALELRQKDSNNERAPNETGLDYGYILSKLKNQK